MAFKYELVTPTKDVLVSLKDDDVVRATFKVFPENSESPMSETFSSTSCLVSSLKDGSWEESIVTIYSQVEIWSNTSEENRLKYDLKKYKMMAEWFVDNCSNFRTFFLDMTRSEEMPDWFFRLVSDDLVFTATAKHYSEIKNRILANNLYQKFKHFARTFPTEFIETPKSQFGVKLHEFVKTKTIHSNNYRYSDHDTWGEIYINSGFSFKRNKDGEDVVPGPTLTNPER